MKKKDNSLLIAVLCGIVVCFIFVGLYILSPAKETETGKNTEEKGNELPNTEVVENNAEEEKAGEEEISLGDIANCAVTTTTYKWDDGTSGTATTSSCNVSPTGCVGDVAPTGTPSSASATHLRCRVTNGGASGCSWSTTTYKAVVASVTCSKCNGGSILNAAGTCTKCSAGTYSTAGSTSCTKCKAGTYSTYGSSSCTKCTAGTYSGDGASSCTKCAAGTYSSTAGASSCTSCAAGTYQDGTGHTECKKCTAGTYSGAKATSCKACSVGTYSSIDGASSCTKCSAGTYQNETGQKNCNRCEPKTYQNEEGMSSCKTCPSGTYTAAYAQTKCAACPAGSYCSGGEKIACDAGKSSLANSQMPSDCTACAAGTYNSTKGGTCKPCTAGKYSAAGATSCTSCPSPYTTSEDGKIGTCYKSIEAGYHLVAGTTVRECDKGTYSTDHNAYYNKTDNCSSCPDGKTTASKGAKSKAECNVSLSDSAMGCYCNSSGTSCSWREGGNASFPSKNTTLNSYEKCKTKIQTTCCYKSSDGYTWNTTTMNNCTDDENKTTCEARNNTVCSNGQYLNSANKCTTCEAGHYCNNSKKYDCPAGSTSTAGKSFLSDCTKCTGTNEWSEKGGTCQQCPTGTHPNTAKSDCICDYGKYLKDGKCTTCPVNSWCNGKDIIACGSGKAAPKGTNSSAKCVSCTGNTIPGSDGTCTECATGTEANSTHTKCENVSSGKAVASVTPTGKHYYLALPYSDSSAGSTISVTFTAKDADSKTTSVNWSFTPTDWSYATSKLNKSKGTDTSITFTAAKSGGSSTQSKTYTITGKNSASKTANVTITVYCKWNLTGNSNGKYSYGGTTSKKSDRNGMRYSAGCYAYEIEKTVEKSGKTYYYYDKVYNRCCGTSPQTAPKEKCYKDSSGKYHWTSTKQTGYTEVTSITIAEKCVTPKATPACYVNGDKYYWGTSPASGYKKVSSITAEKDCKKPDATYACYVKGDDYKWAKTAPTGYTKKEGVNTATACVKPESPACYLHNGEYIWGLYKDTEGYIPFEDITTQAKCKVPVNEACYKNADGEYEWGDFADDRSYTKITSIKSIDDCVTPTTTPTPVPVPQTALNVSQLIYVFMAVLMAIGIGFIYYANMNKKEE